MLLYCQMKLMEWNNPPSPNSWTSGIEIYREIPWIMVHRNFHLNIAKQTTPKTWQYHTFSTEDFNPLNLLHLIFSRTWDWVVYRLWLLSFVLFSKHLVAAFVWLSSTYPAVELHGSQGTHVTRQNLSKL